MSDKILNIHEIKNSFSAYAKRVMKGNSFLIAIRNKPFARLSPLEQSTDRAVAFGVLRGKFALPEDFNRPLEQFERDFYEGS